MPTLGMLTRRDQSGSNLNESLRRQTTWPRGMVVLYDTSGIKIHIRDADFEGDL